MILDLERLSGQSHATLHIVLAAVGGTGDNLTILCLVLTDGLATSLIDGVEVFHPHVGSQGIRVRTVRIELIANAIAHLVIVIRLILRSRAKGIASREVEHYDVVQFYLTQSLHTTVVPMGPLDKAFTLHHRQRVLGQRHRQRGLGDTRSIANLRHEEIVARQQRFLKRTRWNDVVLEKELVDEVDGYQSKHQGIDP